MKRSIYSILGIIGLLLTGCQKDNSEDQVVSQRYIHKYGYAVSKAEWDAKNYPGQVITNLSNGVTITATYENGYLHGPATHTFPHSQTVESYFLYNQGSLVKETRYDNNGMPVRETTQLSPTRYTVTLWFAEGTPLSVEEYANEELLDGQYFTVNNELESRVEKGNGIRTRRDRNGGLLSKETIGSGFVTRKETFFANGAPESLSLYKMGKLNGEKRIFAESGEPIAIEEWIDDKLHGKSSYFKNGLKYLEISYLHGAKNGMETHFVDGQEVAQEVLWENDKKHGPSIYYVEGQPHVQYYYDGDHVTKAKYDELSHLDEMISHISSENQIYESVD